MFQKQIIHPPKSQNLLFHVLGFGVLCINKLRYAIRGYREPRPFASNEIERAIAYDQQVVTNWLDALHDYTGETVDQKVVLELGPGADLGPALFLLDRGASRYVTLDANRLIDNTPTIFYDELLKTVKHTSELKKELDKTLAGKDERIRYLVDPTFDVSTALEKNSVDVVVSQAAFEHFSNVDQTIKQLNAVVKKGGVLIAEVDLMTHTGAVRSRDPLNIYRFSNLFYRFAKYSGIPNRLRPIDYKTILEQNGWGRVEIIPLQQLSNEYTKSIQRSLAKRFRRDDADMNVLTILIRATKT